jgi:hypothetical protein
VHLTTVARKASRSGIDQGETKIMIIGGNQIDSNTQDQCNLARRLCLTRVLIDHHKEKLYSRLHQVYNAPRNSTIALSYFVARPFKTKVEMIVIKGLPVSTILARLNQNAFASIVNASQIYFKFALMGHHMINLHNLTKKMATLGVYLLL